MDGHDTGQRGWQTNQVRDRNSYTLSKFSRSRFRYRGVFCRPFLCVFTHLNTIFSSFYLSDYGVSRNPQPTIWNLFCRVGHFKEELGFSIPTTSVSLSSIIKTRRTPTRLVVLLGLGFRHSIKLSSGQNRSEIRRDSFWWCFSVDEERRNTRGSTSSFAYYTI